jgi:hypothetical protein
MLKITLGICIFLSLNSFAQDLTLGLRAYYPFDGNALDASGNNNNPIINTATLTSDQFGTPNSAYAFNGINTYMQVLNSPSLNMGNTMSIALKVYPTGFYTGSCYNNMLIIKANADFVAGYYFLRFSDIINGCTPNASTTGQQFYGFSAVSPNPIVNLNNWYNVVWTADGTNYKIYVNCVLQATYPQNASTNFTNFFDLYIGKLNNTQYPYWFNGVLDEIRIYDRALTADEVNIYSNCVIVPVQLTQFNVQALSKSAMRLDWKTEQETAMREYRIQRKTTLDLSYQTIDRVAAKTNQTQNSYSFIDRTISPNISYQYRLEMVNSDGTLKYSNIKEARIDDNEKYISLSSNPASSILGIRSHRFSGPINLKLINTMGQVVLQKPLTLHEQQYTQLDISKIPDGTYILFIQTGKTSYQEKLVIHN